MSSRYETWREFLAEQGQPAYRYDQLLRAVFRERVSEFGRMSALPRELREKLSARFGESVLSIEPVARSDSEQATKVLFQIPRGERVEAVRMKYRAAWESFCISSQSGCNLACAFCATGAIGLKRSLTADEITDQVLYFHLEGHKIDSISFMGMGEPFANPATFEALGLLTDPKLFALSPRRVTISTVGVIPGMVRLREEFPRVNLVFSLHSPFPEQRSQLVPLNRRYPLEEVMEVLDEHIRETRRQVSIAYILLGGINDTPAHADAVASLLKDRGPWSYLYHVNLIRYNPAVGAPEEFARPVSEAVNRFLGRLRDAGINVTLRQSFGTDIDAACGQLYGRYAPKLTQMGARTPPAAL
ncbi:MAG TPA: 23S rRNA (adenine(2503)-C(8))-methyltransferase Cfr [Longimicrobiaceae bacterium]|nr:23S rRNA (adenine(2503)-C(8))-methyltransferase Cfr [Longimicrobiaceae bacterium]